MGLKPSDDELRSILSEIDLMYHGQMELQDYLQVDGSRQSAGVNVLHAPFVLSWGRVLGIGDSQHL